jgi:hypothetical protein
VTALGALVVRLITVWQFRLNLYRWLLVWPSTLCAIRIANVQDARMGWSVGYLPPREPELLNRFLLSVGKALSIAHGFESKCKHIVGVISIVEKRQEGHEIDAVFEMVKGIQKKKQKLCGVAGKRE